MNPQIKTTFKPHVQSMHQTILSNILSAPNQCKSLTNFSTVYIFSLSMLLFRNIPEISLRPLSRQHLTMIHIESLD